MLSDCWRTYMVQIFAWNVHGCTIKICQEQRMTPNERETVMKAIVFARAGDPREVLEIRDIAEPAPKTAEVVVEVSARPIHPADLAFIRGGYRVRPALPQVAGLSGLGRVKIGDPRAGLPDYLTEPAWPFVGQEPKRSESRFLSSARSPSPRACPTTTERSCL
jgi:hypothetical protein